MKKMTKRNLVLNFAILLILSFIFAFAGCNPTVPEDSSSSGKPNKPGEAFKQDLSRFDSVQHYGFSSNPKYVLTLATEGATFGGGKKSVKLEEKAVLPQITLSGDGYIGGVKIQGKDKVYETYRFRMPAEDTTIEAVITNEKPELFQVLDVNTAQNGSIGPDYDSAGVKSVESGSPFVLDAGFSMNVKDNSADVNGNTSEDYLRGKTFEVTGGAGSFARLLTGCGAKDTEYGIAAGSTYTFIYNFENKGETPVSFKFYQLQGGIALADSSMVNAGQTIKLEKGENKSFNLEFTAKSGNNNIMPVFQLQSEAKKALIGIAIGKKAGKTAHEHKIEKIEAQEPVCTGTGNKEYYGCVGCGAMYDSADGAKKVTMLDVGTKGDHDYGEWKYTEEEHYRACKNCGKQADKSKHYYKFVTVKEPTDTTEGLREEVCVICGKKSGKTETIDKVAPEDTGVKKVYRLEAECAETVYGESTAERGNYSDAYNLRFGTTLSGLLATANMNKAVGDKQIFKFNSDKALSKVVLRMKVGNYGDTIVLSDYFNLTINGEEVDLTSTTLGAENSVVVDNNKWLRFATVEFEVSLKNGENQLVFEHTQTNSNIGNLDYVEFETSATISGFDNNKYTDTTSVWAVTKQPGIIEEGELTCTSGDGEKAKIVKYVLPVLRKESSVYGYASDGDSETYTLTIKGVKILEKSIDVSKKYTLTVRNADGVFGTYELKVGDAFPAEAKDENAIGYYNADDTREFGSIEEFVMPEKDFNLTFYYEDKTAAQKLIPGSFKVGDYTSAGVTIEGTQAIIDGKLGMLVSFGNAVGEYFRIVTVCGTKNTALGIQAGRTYKFDYTFVNYGDRTLKLKAIAVQGGVQMTEEDGAVISDEITLAKGEKKTVTLTITLANANDNAMLCIVCPEANADAKLGMTATKTNADASEHMHTLTLGDGVNATFENGLKTATVEWGGAMPKVVFSDASFTAGGWYEKDNEAVIFGKDGFIMPDRDITVLPLKESVGTVISFGDYKHDYASNLTYDPATRKGSVVDGKKGEEITLVPTATGTAKIRFQSSFGSKKTLDGMTFHYIIENRGETKVKFTLYQVNAGTTLIAGAEAVVELEAGEVKSVEIKMPANGYSNNNALSYFVFTIDEAKPITLGISLSYEEIAE